MTAPIQIQPLIKLHLQQNGAQIVNTHSRVLSWTIRPRHTRNMNQDERERLSQVLGWSIVW